MLSSNDKVTATVKVLLALAGENQTTLAGVLGVTPTSVSNRVRGFSRWSVDELDTLARHFDVQVSDLIEPPAFLLRRLPGHSTDTVEYQWAGAVVVPFQRRPGFAVERAA